MEAVARSTGKGRTNCAAAAARGQHIIRFTAPPPCSTSFPATQSSDLQLSNNVKNLGKSITLKWRHKDLSALPARRRSVLTTLTITQSVHEIAEVNGTQYEGSNKPGAGKKKKPQQGEMSNNKTLSSSTTTTPTKTTTFEELHSTHAGFNAVLGAIASFALAADKQRRSEQLLADKMDLSAAESFRQGRLVEGRRVYRQTFVIRSYEVGVDKAASIDTFMNHLQETALNHVWMSGLAGDGFGATHGMIRNDLIWVVTCMRIEVDAYPAWGDVVEVDTWVAASGKNGMRRDWLVRNYKTGQIISRATSTWVTMNQNTRRLSKMPDEVRAEISPFHLERFSMKDKNTMTQKIERLDDTAQFVQYGLTPRRSDLDMNQHVNNVKYVGWVMESVPVAVHEKYELSSMALEYRRECSQSDVLQSMCSPASAVPGNEGEVEVNGAGCSHSAGSQTSIPDVSSHIPPCLQFTHLLRLQVDGAEILRGRTHWRLRDSKHSD
ncbi:hypothetical protein CY35_02G027000 [Sphagnum magellanicum]|nr:hypothetical protein CY35_02G027000 [Sphagnum magellanicum]